MRHDPASGALVILLRSLKMYGMAQAVDELAQQGAPAVVLPFGWRIAPTREGTAIWNEKFEA
jgi:hypothetical protein